MTEPFATITQRGRARRRLATQLNQQLKELARSQPHQQEVVLLRSLPDVLDSIETRETDLLAATVERLLQSARSIELSADTLHHAIRYRELYDLSMQDAMIYAAVILDLQVSSKDNNHYFINKNWKDFGKPQIREELRTLGCIFVESFVEGARRIAGR